MIKNNDYTLSLIASPKTFIMNSSNMMHKTSNQKKPEIKI